MPATCYFPVRLHSIIAAGALNFRVRDGNGCFIPAVVTGKKDAHARVESGSSPDFGVFEAVRRFEGGNRLFTSLRVLSRRAPGSGCGAEKNGQASRLISTGRLNTLPCLHLRPIDPVVFREP